jgi:hypothetical protein
VLKAKPDSVDVALQRQLGGFLGDGLQLSIQEDLGRESRTILAPRGRPAGLPGWPLVKGPPRGGVMTLRRTSGECISVINPLPNV